MDCLISPVTKLRSLSSAAESRRLSYRNLTKYLEEPFVRVVVGKEKKEFMVESYILEENPFRVLLMSNHTKNRTSKVVWLAHIDSILFEHLLWLLQNDVSTFSDIDVAEIIDFYSQNF